jgi:hypothetical protein
MFDDYWRTCCWILLEKGPSIHHISEDQQFLEKIIFYQLMKVANRRDQGTSQAPTPPSGAGQALAAPPYDVATLAHVCHHPLAYMVVPKT